ncbi:hypothetical protein G9A89_000642 [Geosiphon pyriformis]|nr:hypothetical protein G9A89_000642 [Geosiphon pyriformis]
MAKTQFVRKFFSLVNGFGGPITPSKFEKIIRSTFTSESSMEKTMLLAKKKEIVVNIDLKRQGICSDQVVVIKKISINMPKDMIVAALAEFGEIMSIKIQLIGLWQKTVVEFAELDQAKQLAAKWFFLIGKNLVHMAMTVSDCETWTLRDRFRALLFTLPVGTTAHNLSTLLNGAGGKTCVINYSMNSGNQVCCAVVGFRSEENLESAYHTKLIFGDVKLSWAKLNLVCCEKCGYFGHSVLECDTLTLPIFKSSRPVKRVSSVDHHLQLVKLYTKKSVSISRPAVFGGKSWAQVVLLVSPSSGPHFNSGFGSGSFPSGSLSIKRSAPVIKWCEAGTPGVYYLSCTSSCSCFYLFFSLSFLVLEDKVVDLGLSSSKVLTFKVGGLKSKMMALKVSIGSILGKLDLLCINSGFLRIAMYNVRSMLNLAIQEDIVCWHKDLGNMILIFDGLQIFTSGLDVGFRGAGHVSKVNEISGHLIFVCLLFKNKLFVMILSLYAGASIGTQFSQAVDINSMVFKVVNFSSFVVLGGNFNENRSGKSVEKVINFILVSRNLAFAMILYSVNGVSKFFDTDHKSVFISIGLVKASKVNGIVLNSVSLIELIKHLRVIKKRYRKSKYCKFKVAEDTVIKKAIDYYIENFCSNKGKIIKSILEYPFCKVVLDHLVVDNELVIEPNEVKLKIGIEELFLVVDNLPNNKAARLSEIPNKLWKYCGREVLACLLKLLNLCLSMDTVSNLVLTNTRSITLVKTACKILFKILSDWISLVCSKFNVLCGNNFSVLKGTSTQSLIFAIGLAIKDALEKNRELWLMLQDMCKAYDSVGWYHLYASLHHIKILKRHEHLCEYRIDSKFVAKSGKIEYILNIASKFFVINDILINNNKTVAISINQRVKNALLLIDRLPILIAKKGKLYQYLSIFLSTKGLSKSSLAQAYKNFSFVILDVCCKWDIMIRKSLRAKASLLRDFLSKILYHLFLYNLKLFEQIQSEKKLVALILFSNGHGIFEHLFDHRFWDLQVLGWYLLNSLQFSVKLHVSLLNNFLAKVVKIFLENELSLVNNLPCSLYYKSVFLLKHFGVAFGDRILDKKRKVIDWKTFWHWKQLDPRSSVPYWFSLIFDFMTNSVSLEVRAAAATKEDVLSVLDSDRFSEIYEFLRCAGSIEVAGGTAAYFLAANANIGVKITGLLSSTLTELQAVVLALECVLSLCSVILYSDS